MSTIVERPGWDVALTVQVASIVIRASELGYSPWRVGIALRIAPIDLAWICAHLNEQDARRQILDATSRRAGSQVHAGLEQRKEQR